MFSLSRTAACAGLLAGAFCLSAAHADGNGVRAHGFLPESPVCRAGRPEVFTVTLENMNPRPVSVTARIVAPEGVAVADGAERTVEIAAADAAELHWTVEADAAGERELGVETAAEGVTGAVMPLRVNFLTQVEQRKLPYIPEPVPVKTPILVGAHHCPLWEADKPFMWNQVLKHPERTPAMGFYAQENPEVSDWETKWAVEHGISFFIYCWYRNGQGGPVKMNFGSAIHEGLFKSKFADKMKFTIMWENQSRGVAGVAGEADLMENLLPFWLENYFKNPGYLKVDNKPVLFIYRPEFLIDDLGGVENVVKAFDKMRAACRAAGFDGLWLLGEYRGLDAKHLALMKSLGLDYSFAYCWYVPDSPTPRRAIDTQLDYIRKTRELAVLPQVATVSQAWSGWADEGSIWKIPPEDFKTLLRRAMDEIAAWPENELGSRMLLLDNWNEWGEGHYIAPYREYGFGYLDAVREVVAGDTAPHEDLTPQDIGMGPYDTAYREWERGEREKQRRVALVKTKPGAPEPGLLGWWAFDEEQDDAVVYDCSGNRLGGVLRDAKRAPGIDGNALVCAGGCVEVPFRQSLSPSTGLTLECWVKTDTANQQNTWFINRVLQGGTSSGYRMGVLDGHPCFEVPLTEWSHHLKASQPLPLGRWVHVAGTFDGKVMRVYVDGAEQGAMERPGPVNANNFGLRLGNYDIKHASFFSGLLDEVRLYDRALTPDEIKARVALMADKR